MTQKNRASPFEKRNAMTKNTNNYCVILAGGKGKRLWPVSRTHCPKQFIDFFGTGRTLLQQTYDRIAKVIPADNIYISTHQEYAYLVREQLPDINPIHILAEPIGRNTAPSTAWACFRVLRRCNDGNLIVVPSDQSVVNEEAFDQNLRDGLDFVARHEGLLTLGVKPTRPEPGYGYVQLGDPTETEDVFRAKSFTEKPDREFARFFMESGEFFWNTGMFLSNAVFMRTCFREILPPVFDHITSQQNLTLEEELKFVAEYFPVFPNISMDHGILEKSDKVYVMKCDFGWADLGMWHSVYEAMSNVGTDNVLLDSDVVMENCHGNIVKLPKGRLGVFCGLDNFIIAEHGNVLFICKKEDSSALVRKLNNEVQIKKGEEYV